MAPIFSLRSFYFCLILICCFLEIFGRGGRGGGRGSGRGGSGGSGRGGYTSHGSRSSSSSGTNSGTGNHGSSSTIRGSSGTIHGSSSTIHGSSSTIHGTDNNSYRGSIGHNFNGNSFSKKFSDRHSSSSDFDINSNYKQDSRPQIDWNYKEKQKETDESLERIKNWRLGSFDGHKYGSTYKSPYGSTFEKNYETYLKGLPKDPLSIYRESGPYTRKANTHNSASIPSGSLSAIGNQELQGRRFRNSRRNSVGGSKCDVKKLTNDPSIYWVCTRIKKQKECTLKCTEPKKFSAIAADKYTCKHGIWTPNHVPQCI